MIDDKLGSMLIQATTTGHCPERVRKITGPCYDAAFEWLESENRIEVWGWSLKGKAGKRKTWQLKTYVVDLELLQERAA